VDERSVFPVGRTHYAQAVCLPQRRDRPKECCLELRQPPNRPDPATYSQLEQLALGLEPTWNSPDIVTNSTLPWGPWPSIDVIVRNKSTNASAVNALVHLALGAFGIGVDRLPLSAQVVTLSPSEEKALSYPLAPRPADADPNISVLVTIEHPTDANRRNNRGEQAIAGGTTSQVGRSPEIFFPLRNQTSLTQEITLAVLANSLSASVWPNVRNFAPYEQFQAALSLTVPPALHGTPAAPPLHEVTVIARGQDGEVIGGLTYLLWIDD